MSKYFRLNDVKPHLFFRSTWLILGMAVLPSPFGTHSSTYYAASVTVFSLTEIPMFLHNTR